MLDHSVDSTQNGETPSPSQSDRPSDTLLLSEELEVASQTLDNPRTPSPVSDDSDDEINASPPPWKDTPIARKRNGTQDAFLSNKADDQNDDHEREGRGVILGPMPIRAFLDDFLPPVPPEQPMPVAAGAFNKVPKAPKDEREIYQPLVDAINKFKRCPSVIFCITADHAENPGDGALKPDLCVYDPSDLRLVKVAEKRRVAKNNPVEKDTEINDGKAAIIQKHIANLGLAESLAEAKRDGQDPICECKVHSHEPTRAKHKTSFFASDNHKNTKSNAEPKCVTKERRNLGQSIRYPSEVFERQHRVFFFSMMIIGTRVRFFRWDRAGGIVTESTDYRNEPEFLCEFLWRFHISTPVERGFDPSVIVATAAEETLFRTFIRQHAALQLGLQVTDSKELDDALQLHYEKGKVSKIRVFDESRRIVRFFLVSVPTKSPRSLAGRSTRSYWAVELLSSNEGRVLFLKDMWRPCISTAISEGCVYAEMHAKGVVNICDLEIHGDLSDTIWGEVMNEGNHKGHLVDAHAESSNRCCFTMFRGHAMLENGFNGSKNSTDTVQYTRTADYTGEPWVCDFLRDGLETRIIKRVHYRLVLKQAGYPLKTFKSSRELFRASRGVFEALDSSFKKCDRIHRDVNMDNIILYRDGACEPRRGLIVDWEFSVTASARRAVGDYFRSLQWAFLPARVLQRRDYGHQTREDDMEALFYVVMYGTARWLPHNMKRRLGRWMYEFFDAYAKDLGTGEQIAGDQKRIQQLTKGIYFLRDFKFPNKHIKRFFRDGYTYLGSVNPALDNGHNKKLWTNENLRRLFDDVCGALDASKDAVNDRTENDVSDYFKPQSEVGHGTHTPIAEIRTHYNGTVEISRLRRRPAEDGISSGVGVKRKRFDNGTWVGDTVTQLGTRKSSRLAKKGAVNAAVLGPDTYNDGYKKCQGPVTRSMCQRKGSSSSRATANAPKANAHDHLE